MVALGPFTRAQLAEQGMTASEICDLLAEGRYRTVRRRWLADGFTSEAAIRALELNGRLACVSACRLHGLWVPPDNALHVAVNPGRSRGTTTVEPVRFHRLERPSPTAVVPLDQAVAQVMRWHDLETGLIVVESAVNLGLMHESEARGLLDCLPRRKARAAQFFSPLAQSGSETRLRLFFQRHRVPVTPQAYVPGVGRVDLLVGRSWIIEADSQAHHSSRQDVLVDRTQDMNAGEAGYDRDRLSYEQIWETWERTQQWLLARLRTRRHLRPPSPLR